MMVPDKNGVPVATYCYTTTDITFNNKVLNIQKLAAGDPSPNVIITLTNTLYQRHYRRWYR